MLTSDGRLLFMTRAVRTFAYGCVSVVLGLYLAGLGLSATQVGLVFTAALAGSALMTVAVTAVADRAGRQRVLLVSAVLMGLSGAVFALTDQFALLVAAAIIGTISPSGGEVGPFLSLEQAILPQTTADSRRTSMFAWYNLTGSFATALGALAAGAPGLLAPAFGMTQQDAYRGLLVLYVGLAGVLLLLYTRLSPKAEAPPAPAGAARGFFGLHRSLKTVAQLSLVFSMDSFGGGFLLQSFVAYWFTLRFGVEATALAPLFFGTNMLAGVSFLAAAWLARRIGLINTMAFTHLPSNLLVMALPFMPNFESAALVWLARSLLSSMDIPTRQSYTMAVVEPDERSAAAGFTSVARNAAQALSPGLAGMAVTAGALWAPFLVGGGIKAVYDLVLLAMFRSVRPPEEQRAHTEARKP